MDFENFFYVILAVIYILSRVLKAKKKAPQETYDETEGEPPKKTVTFEDLLKEFTGAEEEEIPEPVVEPAPEVRPKRYEPKYTDEESRSIFEKSIKAAEEVGSSDKPKESKQLIFKEFEPYQQEEPEVLAEEIADMLRSEDGSKKAIILSEILNRKY
jgi:HEPN domain-containing protein